MICRIEQVGTESIEALAVLHAQCFAPGWASQEFASLLATPGAFALLGWGAHACQPAAMALAWVQARQGEILTLATAPEHRRQGAARAMVQAIMQHAAALKAEAVFLEVAHDNAAAKALYAGQGFVEAGRRAHYYRTPSGLVDALVLRRALAIDPGPL